MLDLPGLQNIVADFLSRPSLPAQLTSYVIADPVALLINFKEMAAEQNRCTET